MCSILRTLHKIATGATAMTVTVVIIFVVIMTPNRAFAASAISASSPREPNQNFRVKWSNPKLIKLIDEQHGRFEFDGQSEPGVTIQVETGASAIETANKLVELTIQKLAPDPRELTVGQNGRFKFVLTLPFDYSEIPFVATANKIHRHYVLSMPFKNQHFKFNSRLNLGVQVRSVSYSQTNLSNLDETMLAIGVSYRLKFKTRWSFVAQSLIDVANDTPFATGQSDNSAKFWNASANFIYSIPLHKTKWSIGIASGAFYATMFSSGATFGFHNLWGPEVYPIAVYSLNKKRFFDCYFKYAPVVSQTPMNLGNYEANAGIEWTSFNKDKRSVSVKFELLQDVLNQSGDSTKSTAVNLGVSFGVP